MSTHEFETEWDLKPNEFEVDLESVVTEVFPELEDLEVTPTGGEQNFKSENYYGFNNVKVNAVESEEIHIIPNTENQVNEGIYKKVTVVGDKDLIPDNIKKDTIIFGVEGTLEIVLTKEEYDNCLKIAENILDETEYTELQYIESTGNQYIDTGLKLTKNHKLEMTISHFDTNGNRKTFGSRASATSNNFSVVSGPVGGIMSIVADFHNYQNNRIAYVINEDEKIDILISNKLLKINDLEKEVTTYDAFETPDNAYLFNCSGSYPNGYTMAAMKLYMCKIYENDILVRNFIPVRREEDGEICLYDKIERKFYTNIGTGKFNAGDEYKMSTALELKLQRILEEKKSKVLSENIKKGINIFGVEGNY